MNSQEILDLLQYGEHINLECKKAESTLPNSVWETDMLSSEVQHLKKKKDNTHSKV